jgi:hypothetical protein
MPKNAVIKIQNTDIPDRIPASLNRGELAVNLADLVLYVGNTVETAIPLLGKDYLISSTRYGVTTTGITAPEKAEFLELIGCGGGGGGGGGCKIGTGQGLGGCGGQGGRGGKLFYSLKELGITAGVTVLKVQIGSGGTGGAGFTLGGTLVQAGNDGQNGESTYLKSNDDSIIYVEFPGGQGGVGGPNGTDVSANNHTLNFQNKLEGVGGPVFVAAGSFRSGPGTGSRYGGGGGGGAGYQPSTTDARAVGSDGGKANTYNTSFRIGGGGAGGVTYGNGGSHGVTSEYGGSGGGGGSCGNGQAPGNGGNGGTGGGGGGGGGAYRGSSIAIFTGFGGTGGNGYLILNWWSLINQTHSIGVVSTP